MFVSKKKWKEQEDKIAALRTLYDQLNSNMDNLKCDIDILNRIHPQNGLFCGYYVNMYNGKNQEYKISRTHEQIKTNTASCDSVTFEELARFVIDHEPIKREIKTTKEIKPECPVVE